MATGASINVNVNNLIDLQKRMADGHIRFCDISDNLDKQIGGIVGSEWNDEKAQEFQLMWINRGKKELLQLAKTLEEFSSFLTSRIEIMQRYSSKSIH